MTSAMPDPDGSDTRLSHGPTVQRAVTLLADAEAAREAAIKALLDERRDIEAQLARLGHVEKAKKKAPERTCSRCGEAGHTTRGCPQKATKGASPSLG